jgi:GAF domain-containing protein
MASLEDKLLELRLAVLRDYEIMDTPPEEDFDDITRLAAYICQTPIATITLLDQHRQWFKSKVGVNHCEDSIEHSFCYHAIQNRGIFQVDDATLDDRFATNPLVTADHGIRAYVGSPLVTDTGIPFGTLCAIDRVPHSFNEDQCEALASLSRMVVKAMEMRKTARALSQALKEKKEAENEISLLQEILPMCGWCHKVRDDEDYWSSVEGYITSHTNTRISHGICPDCLKKIQKEYNLQD